MLIATRMQVLLLGHQLLHKLLLPSAPDRRSGAEVLQNSLALAAQGAEMVRGPHGPARAHEGPTAWDIDRAIKAIEGCIDWPAMQELWAPPVAALGVELNDEASHQQPTRPAEVDGLGPFEKGCASATMAESKPGPGMPPQKQELSGTDLVNIEDAARFDDSAVAGTAASTP